MITRSHVSGALRLLNANNTPNRRGWLHNMLKAEHSASDVAKALDDLESYPEWTSRKDLETPVAVGAGDAPAVAAAVAVVAAEPAPQGKPLAVRARRSPPKKK